MNKTIIFLIINIIIIVCFTQSINGDVCSCNCCRGNSCNPTFQGRFTVASCGTADCLGQCRTKYQACPSSGDSGSSQGICLSGAYAPQQKANFILVTLFFSLLTAVKWYL